MQLIAEPRPADALRDRGVAAARSEGAVPRRADHRAGRREQAGGALVYPGAQPDARHDGAADHARHAGHRGAGGADSADWPRKDFDGRHV